MLHKNNLNWQCVCCKLSQLDKILSMTREADSKFVDCSTRNHWFQHKELGQPLLKIMWDTKLNWTKVRTSMFILVIFKF